MSESVKTEKKPSDNGKGSKRREEKPKKVRDNWDGINGFRPSKFK